MSNNNDTTEGLSMLIAMGFNASQARVSLERNGGNVEQAANDLLNAPNPGNESSLCTMVQGTTSQYSYENGRSACTCIALQGAMHFLTNHGTAEPIFNTDVLDQILQEGCRLYVEWQRSSQKDSSVDHTSVEDVLHLFPHLACDGVRQGLLGGGDLLPLLQDCSSPTDPVGVILIKPPETVLLCLPPTTSDDGSFYWLDSHPRPSEFGTEYAYCRTHASFAELVTETLSRVFSPTDLGPDVPEYMAAMYNSVDVYPLRLKRK